MLQAEVTALKTLVITSTPSSPNRDLHPQLLSPSKNALRKGHARNKSAGCAVLASPAPTAQPTPSESKEVVHITYEPGWPLPEDSSSSFSRQVDTLLYSEFLAWKESPTLDRYCPFLSRIYLEDIKPYLDFAERELSEQVLTAVEGNMLSVEPVVQPILPVVKASAVERGGPRYLCVLNVLGHKIGNDMQGNMFSTHTDSWDKMLSVGHHSHMKALVPLLARSLWETLLETLQSALLTSEYTCSCRQLPYM
ncbi:guanine nucleotide exchange factor for Rab-3A-like isoform X1 [Xenopus tropicalis]|uniref:Guanine nucleotide exchange factor for Rab-3A-like isoform X1 n=1 Tax=Xenopus tropicalis TaxID=8364 RepID=A0A8J1JEU6_XENTR|nr:guanine nucleotide exchange factor for Rab-3A-like isoform X1 [Xenopus tropicalis]